MRRRRVSSSHADIILSRLLGERQREVNGEASKKGPQFDQMLREIAKSFKQESKEQVLASRLSKMEAALERANAEKNSVFASLYE
jgi:hypothetical protein